MGDIDPPWFSVVEALLTSLDAVAAVEAKVQEMFPEYQIEWSHGKMQNGKFWAKVHGHAHFFHGYCQNVSTEVEARLRAVVAAVMAAKEGKRKDGAA